MNDNTEKNTFNSYLRTFSGTICQGVYFLLGGVYDILLLIAKQGEGILSSGIMENLFVRVQLIIGVFMLFRLAIVVLQGIVNPDAFTDSKKGFQNVIVRVIVALVLLTLIIPIKIPNKKLNSYEENVSHSGILFGTLNEFQKRILEGEVLEKLIVGPINYNEKYGSTGENLSAIVLKSFFTPNIKPGVNNPTLYKDTKTLGKDNPIYRYQDGKGYIKQSDGTIKKVKKSDLYCDDKSSGNEQNDDPDPDGAGDVISDAASAWGFLKTAFSSAAETLIGANGGSSAMSLYKNALNFAESRQPKPRDIYSAYYISQDTNVILSMVNYGCKNGTGHVYMFNFHWFVGLIVGLIFLIILVMMCIDIGKRVIKLAILQLLAPIPIISYISPNSDFKNGPLGAWIKTLVTTYLELFVNLAVLFFAIFLIQQLSMGKLFDLFGSGAIGMFAKIFIFIALLLFAKQAPKFIKQAIGLKEDGSGFLSGITGALAGVGAGAAGALGSARTNFRATKEEQDKLHPGHDKRNMAKSILSGLAGGVGGAGTGFRAASSADKKKFSAGIKAMQERNARRAAHSTMPGRAADTLYGLATGQSLADKASTNLELNKKAFGDLKNWKSSIKEEAIKNGGKRSYTLSNGQTIRDATLDQIYAGIKAGADSNGNYTINGAKIEASSLGDVAMDDIVDEYIGAWQRGEIGDGKNTYHAVVTGEGKLSADHERVIKSVSEAGVTVNDKSGVDLVDSYGDLGPAMGVANRAQQEYETDMKQQMRIANKQNKS